MWHLPDALLTSTGCRTEYGAIWTSLDISASTVIAAFQACKQVFCLTKHLWVISQCSFQVPLQYERPPQGEAALIRPSLLATQPIQTQLSPWSFHWQTDLAISPPAPASCRAFTQHRDELTRWYYHVAFCVMACLWKCPRIPQINKHSSNNRDRF